jgi:hypothetical protein
MIIPDPQSAARIDELQAKLLELQAENAALQAVLQDAEDRLAAKRADRQTQANLKKLTQELMRQVRELEAETASANRSAVQRREKLRRRLRAGLAKVASAFRGSTPS